MTVLALVAINVATNRLVPEALYVPFAVAATVALVAIARRLDGRSWSDLGMARADAWSGLAWGGVTAGAVLAVYLVGMALESTREAFLDDRVRDLSFWGAAFASFVRVPLGTVLLEEVAFRSVLPAQLERRTSRAWAIALASLAFGLWHVLPAIGLESVNPVATDTLGELPGWVTVVGSVLATTVAGVWFCWLRYRSRSVLAPMALHWATNGLGYLFAWWAWNR